MHSLPQEVIRKKQQGGLLTRTELADFFGAYLQGQVADYQVSALLMAIYFQGLDEAETLALTELLRDSGERFSWPSAVAPLMVDKHSSGGIGDKTSLILLPLCLLAGVKVPMIAGRGLGHTGGTLDKLAAIPGMRVLLSQAEARRQMDELGGFIMGQTPDMTPLDQRLYALRDVTSTVASQPLIVASILSKKLAEGLAGLVMDVKFGSGAFMGDQQAARTLASALIRVGEASGVRVRALLTNMNSPLGDYAGNALEVYESIAVLQGGGPSDTRSLSLQLASHMVQLAYPERTLGGIESELAGLLDSGEAFECFARLVTAQGGEARYLAQKGYFRQATYVSPVLGEADEATFVASVDVRSLGLAIVRLGGGRRRVDDRIDPQVGLAHMKKVGDYLEKGEPLAVIYGNNPEKVEEARQLVTNAYKCSTTPVAKEPLVAELLDASHRS